MKPYFNYTLVVMLSVLATFFCSDASAHPGYRGEPRVEIKAGISGYPIISAIASDGFLAKTYEEVVGPMGGDILKRLYSDYEGDLYSAGNLYLGAGYRLTKWFTLSGYLMYNQMWRNTFNGADGSRKGTQWSHIVALSPEAKFTFMNKRYVQLYGSVAFSLAFYKEEDSSFLDYSALPHIQTVPFGISTGRRFFGFTEFGLGTEFIGFRAGLGVRF